MVRVTSSKPLVFDACALIAYLKGERGSDLVEGMLRNPANECLAHGVNVCEVLYLAIAATNQRVAEAHVQKLVDDGLRIEHTFDEALWRQVARLKTTTALLDDNGVGPPLADCFCIAFAQRVGADIVTSDHDDFDAVQSSGICAVRFIR